MPEKVEIPDNDGSRRWVVAVLVVAALILVVNIALPKLFLDDWPKRGDFGSMFGLSNAVFSGLALAGVIYALNLQRIELGLQRQELRMTRDELRRTADAQERTEKVLAMQVEHMARSSRAQVIASLITMHMAKNPRAEQLGASPVLGRITLASIEKELEEIIFWKDPADMEDDDVPPDWE